MMWTVFLSLAMGELFSVERTDSLEQLTRGELVDRVKFSLHAFEQYEKTIASLKKEIQRLREVTGEGGQRLLDLEERLLIIQNELFGSVKMKEDRKSTKPKKKRSKCII